MAIRLALVLVVLGTTLLAGSTARAAIRSEFFGIVQGGGLGTRDLKGLARARIHSDRFMLNWGWVQRRSESDFNWAGTDRLIGALASHGVRPVPVLWGNPGWVYGSPARPPLARPRDAQAWRNFLRAAVGRYGPGGTFWSTRYRQLYGPNATPLPIQAWQIWNEPNLSKFFAPYPSPGEYAQLLRISHNAIKEEDHDGQIVLAGMPGYGDVTAWQFLYGLYSLPGVRRYFDAAALHPYARNLAVYKRQIQRFRAVMKNHGDSATPLWITEIAWGSAPPDHYGINKGPAGQAQLLRRAFDLILSHRAAWNVQRVFWYHWRDPRRSQATCSFCASAGLVNANHVPKPAYSAFTRFSATKQTPKASIASGPNQGALIHDPTPTFRFTSNQVGSTFQCRLKAGGAWFPCRSPFTPSTALPNGGHGFWARAVDAAGNVSVPASRSFTVDTVAPRVRISAGPVPGATSSNPRPRFKFVASESDVTFRCRLDSGGFEPCSSPHRIGPLADGHHTFAIVATDAAGNLGPAATRAWTLDANASG
ncbi:MAG: Ig-like domain-containing protein [Solirubrobacterales bacterium]